MVVPLRIAILLSIHSTPPAVVVRLNEFSPRSLSALSGSRQLLVRLTSGMDLDITFNNIWHSSRTSTFQLNYTQISKRFPCVYNNIPQCSSNYHLHSAACGHSRPAGLELIRSIEGIYPAGRRCAAQLKCSLIDITVAIIYNSDFNE